MASRATLSQAASADIPYVALPCLAAIVSPSILLAPTIPPAALHRSDVSEPHAVVSLVLLPSRADPLYCLKLRPEPTSVTLAEPVAAWLILAPRLTPIMSADMPNVKLRARPPILTDARLLAAPAALARHRSDV